MRYFHLKSILSTVALVLFFAQFSFSQCDPNTATHYNVGDFPFITSGGVIVTQSGSYSQTAGPYTFSCGTVEANSFTIYPGDTLIFTFSQPITELSFVAGAMNTTENGKVLTNNGLATLSTACVDISVTGDAFIDVGPLTCAPITMSIPAGATVISIVDLPAASTNGYYTIDLLGCIIGGTPCVPSASSIAVTECDLYTAPSGVTFNSTGNYVDVIPNNEGCDSTINIDLTILNSSFGSITETTCGTYIAPSGNTYNSTGIYTDVIANSSGCDSIITIDLTINSVNTIVNNFGNQLTALQSPANYQWLDCENSFAIINGENGQTFFPTSNGLYAVQISQGNCVDTSACESISVIGLNEIDLTTVNIFPNPTEGKVNVILGEASEIHVIIRSITGQIIDELDYNAVNKFELDLVGPSGFYFIELAITDQEKRNFKVIKR